jgi:hypothetical protein
MERNVIWRWRIPPLLFTKSVYHPPPDRTEEPLQADTLRVGQDNILYCTVKEGLYEARLLRNAYYQLAEFLEQDGQNYYLVIDGSKVHLKNL